MRLILVRHGESVGNYENRLQGQSDFELTDLGRRQAALAGEKLAAEGVSAVYTSPLLRASQTAAIIADKVRSEPRTLPGVREYDFGELSGLTYAELRERYRTASLSDGRDRVYPGEEGRENFYRRVTDAVWDVCDQHREETVAVISHGGPIALFCQSALGLPYRRPMPFAIENCSLNVFRVRDEAPPADVFPRAVLISLNDVCHLAPLRA